VVSIGFGVLIDAVSRSRLMASFSPSSSMRLASCRLFDLTYR